MHRALLVIGDTMEKYDVFISHASKDKAAYVDKLAETIKKQVSQFFMIRIV